MFRRIFFFILTNLLVMMMISIVLSVLGVRPYLSANGIDYEQLMLFCLVWGMGGAFISLMISKLMAKWMMGVKIIDPESMDSQQRELVRIVHNLAKSANLTKMPDVGIYESMEINAFATGPSKNNSLVAVSSGLLQRMGRAEVEGVLGHEVSHIANGDMVTMTLVQGVVNAFVMFFARIAAYVVANLLKGNDERSPSRMIQSLLVFAFDIMFGVLGSIVVCYVSRQREFRADQGGATLAGREKMIGALQALQRSTDQIDYNHPAMASLKISSPKGLFALLMTHPPLEQRIERLKNFT